MNAARGAGLPVCWRLIFCFVFQLLLSEDREEARRRNAVIVKEETARRDEEPVSVNQLLLSEGLLKDRRRS